MIKWIRYRYQIPAAKLKDPDELTVQQVAEHFGVNPNVVYYWIQHSVIQARRLNSGTMYWIKVSETDEQKLQDWVRNSRKIQTAS
jgi:transposase-like protein